MTTTTEVQAGRELDALVAEKVMGRCDHQMAYVPQDELESRERKAIMAEWQAEYGTQPPNQFIMDEAKSRASSWDTCDYPPKECTKCGISAYGTALTPKYSTDIAAAWEVVEKLRSQTYTLELYSPYALINDERGEYAGDSWYAMFVSWEHIGRLQPGCAIGDTCAEAICRAALKAVGA